MIFKRQRHKQTTTAPTLQPESNPAANTHDHEPQCIHTGLHAALLHDGWQHASLYHNMLCQASMARWTVVIPQPSFYVSGGLTLCELQAHPDQRVREHGHIAAAIAAHRIAEQ